MDKAAALRQAWADHYKRTGPLPEPTMNERHERTDMGRHPNDPKHEQRCNAPSFMGSRCTCWTPPWPPDIPIFIITAAERQEAKLRLLRALPDQVVLSYYEAECLVDAVLGIVVVE